ncbi:hypothetical protein MTR67_017903 [Solanum verrucosum]|uniref:Uncharacterized protein n=1 Tax=Solanum verrucosum TaxID=315347 RepID=A0AAF0TSR2_SOLVR|nr:hypothetical protein MTR67_017903 [Solanum verrucosum]
MTETYIQIITKEKYQDEESTEQKIIFNNNIFEQIKGKELDLRIENIFEIRTIKNWFKRQKEEYYVVSQREHIIDCKYTQGKAKIPIINKRIINKEIQDIKAKNPIKYVHFGGTEILIKTCFRVFFKSLFTYALNLFKTSELNRVRVKVKFIFFKRLYGN